MQFQQIFWDNDGVLVDTERYYLQASREALASAGLKLSDEQFTAISLSEGRSVFDLAKDAGLNSHAISELKHFRNNRYSELLRANDLTVDGAGQVLKELHHQLNMAVVTSSLKHHFDIIHDKTGFLGYMDFYLTREDYHRSKPSAEPYLLALKKCGFNPETVLVIEDSPRGLAAAKNAGLTCWVIPGQFTKEEDFVDADRTLSSIRDIPRLIL